MGGIFLCNLHRFKCIRYLVDLGALGAQDAQEGRAQASEVVVRHCVGERGAVVRVKYPGDFAVAWVAGLVTQLLGGIDGQVLFASVSTRPPNCWVESMGERAGTSRAGLCVFYNDTFYGRNALQQSCCCLNSYIYNKYYENDCQIKQLRDWLFKNKQISNHTNQLPGAISVCSFPSGATRIKTLCLYARCLTRFARWITTSCGTLHIIRTPH